MKLATHVATALSIALYVDGYAVQALPGYPDNILARAGWLVWSVVLQYAIDGVGHKYVKRRGVLVPARNRVHSLPVMIVLGVGSGAVFYGVLGWLALAGGLAFTVLHYVEDLVTEGGVYLVGRRVRLPVRVTYDDTLVNRLAIVLAGLLLAEYPFLHDPASLVLGCIGVAYIFAMFLRV